MPQRENKSCKVMTHLGNLTLSGTSPASSAWLDTKGADAALLTVIANTVTDAGTASGFSFQMEESDTTAAAAATAVADLEMSDLESTLTVTDDTDDNVIVGAIAYLGSKRYVRLTATGTTGTDADVSIVATSEMLSVEPQTFVGTSVAAT